MGVRAVEEMMLDAAKECGFVSQGASVIGGVEEIAGLRDFAP